MPRVEKCGDTIPSFPLRDFAPDLEDFACTVGAADYRRTDYEGVIALENRLRFLYGVKGRLWRYVLVRP